MICYKKMSLVGSDAPTFSIAETTRTNHFSLLLRKLPNRNLPEFSWTEPTLNSMLILNVVNTDKNFITVLIFKVQASWYSFDQYMQFYTLIKWVSWILRIHFFKKCQRNDHQTVRSSVILCQNRPNPMIVRNRPIPSVHH